MRTIFCCFLVSVLLQYPVIAQQKKPASSGVRKEEILPLIKKVADWQLANPTGKELNSWEYGPFYIGLMSVYQTFAEKKYLQAVEKMGNQVNWEPIARPYDANVLAISQAFLELYQINRNKSVTDKSRFVMDAPMRRELTPDITFDKNKYWWEWWSWCDALFMAPPAYARMAAIFKEPKYKNFMVQEWKRTSGYLYSPADSLYFRDDRFFTMPSANGQKIFWSRGNGWVLAGLARVMQYLPANDADRPFFEQQFREMSYKLKRIQRENGFWSQSLLDAENYPQKESSGTGFYVYALSWGVNSGLLPRNEFMPVISKGWAALKESVHASGKLGYVQEVGDSPTNVKFDDSETYGTGAFLLAGTELYKTFR
ncbi:MAG: glycoside hydrolase family 88 protein [Sediminibacterium sp.]|nr:glycoside hydrolase family 88 protein [Sediminibacterium sp.]